MGGDCGIYGSAMANGRSLSSRSLNKWAEKVLDQAAHA